MTTLFGSTRAVVKRNYALLTPEGFVPSVLPGWSNATCHVVISPALGAGFVQTLVTLAKGGRGTGRTGSGELFAYMLDGDCTLRAGRRKFRLVSESYAYLPPGTTYGFSHAAESTRLLLFEKPYVALGGTAAPDVLVEASGERPGLPFLGDPDARLQTLLPDRPEFDMAVNIFTYLPGATLPMVETHIMEHGLLMLAGQGIYRLDADWHPVREGDVIWMAPYCPQWFVATGKTPASYIYYKDVNRAPRPE
jgi:(S)-ureidoglycine aminohydrolase